MQFASAAVVSDEQEIDLDYLTYNAFSITTPLIVCKKGYLVHISMNDMSLDGVVSDVVPDGYKQTISIRPLQALFDVAVFSSPIADCASWLAEQITAQFINNADSLQNKPIELTFVAGNNPISVEGETLNIIDILAVALKTYGVVCNAWLDMENMKIKVDIRPVTASVTLETRLSNVIEKQITLGDSYGAANKAIIREVAEDGSVLNTVFYYRHNDETITTEDADRITPVFFTLADIQTSEDWTTKAEEKAIELLTPQKYDNEISLTYAVNDRIANPLNIAIGTQATIYVDGASYSSILTGKAFSAGKIQLTFGCVRIDLTKRLILERR